MWPTYMLVIYIVVIENIKDTQEFFFNKIED